MSENDEGGWVSLNGDPEGPPRPLFAPDVFMACERCSKGLGPAERVAALWHGDRICASCATAPPSEAHNPWPALVAAIDAGLRPAPTMDVRTHAAQRQVRERVLSAINARAAEVGPVVPPSFPDAAIDVVLAAHVAVANATPARRKVLAPLLHQALDLAVKLAMLSQPSGGAGEGVG